MRKIRKQSAARRAQINTAISNGMSKKKPEIIQKLREAFRNGATVQIACAYCGIVPQTYYNWVNESPELLEQFEADRNDPIMGALKKVTKDVETTDGARYFLQKNVPDIYGNKIGIKHEGEINMAGGKPDPHTLAALAAYNKSVEQETLSEIDNAPDEL